MSKPLRKSGMSLAEVLLAMALLTICVLTVLGLSLSVLRSDSKASETTAGAVVADSLLRDIVARVKSDTPAGAKDSFWDLDHDPWEEGTRVNNGTEFHYVVTAVTVLDSSGAPLGSSVGNNRLKKVDVRVKWFNEASSDSAARQGYGELETHLSQLIPEAETN